MLVPASHWYPSAPEDYGWTSLALPIACHHLRCERCSERVAMAVEGAARVYRCRCGEERVHAPRALTPAFGRGPESLYAWTCAGHPPLVLPGALDGVDIDGASILRLARVALDGSVPAPWQGTEPTLVWTRHPGLWLARLFALVEDEGTRAALVATAEAGLDDPAPAVRRRAVCFFEHHPRSARVAARVRSELVAPAQWLGVLDPLDAGATLWASLLDALIARGNVESDSDALDTAWQALRAGRGSNALVYLVARRDVQRLGEEAGALALAGLRPGVLLTAVSGDPEASERATRALRAIGVEELDELVAQKLTGDARARAEAALREPP